MQDIYINRINCIYIYSCHKIPLLARALVLKANRARDDRVSSIQVMMVSCPNSDGRRIFMAGYGIIGKIKYFASAKGLHAIWQ